MKYALMLTLLGVTQIAFAHRAGPLYWLLWWSGLSWVAAGCAYAGLEARVFGKRVDGEMAWSNVCLLLPYLTITWFLWHMQRLLTREPPHNEIAPDLWLGRRCFDKELPLGIGLIVDLTAEFSEPKELRTGRSYRCVPVLDASVPSLKEFQELIQAIATSPKPVYVHCALGHGRSATVVVAVIMARGSQLHSTKPSILFGWRVQASKSTLPSVGCCDSGKILLTKLDCQRREFQMDCFL
jgi:protein-tyrosine phosphatase